ncbi:hypothetical protein BH24CHL4_BH24CHL4_07360 [soil metagenome]
MIARPGKAEHHQNCSPTLAPWLTMAPHSAVGGMAPNPRKLRLAVSKMAPPMSKVPFRDARRAKLVQALGVLTENLDSLRPAIENEIAALDKGDWRVTDRAFIAVAEESLSSFGNPNEVLAPVNGDPVLVAAAATSALTFDQAAAVASIPRPVAPAHFAHELSIDAHHIRIREGRVRLQCGNRVHFERTGARQQPFFFERSQQVPMFPTKGYQCHLGHDRDHVASSRLSMSTTRPDQVKSRAPYPSPLNGL